MVEVIVAAISSMALVLAAAVPAYLNLLGKVKEVKQDTHATKDQVKNDHQTNLRHELDERHNSLVDGFKSMADKLDGVGKDVRGMRQDIGVLFGQDRDLRGEVRDNAERLDRLEKKPQRGSPPIE